MCDGAGAILPNSVSLCKKNSRRALYRPIFCLLFSKKSEKEKDVGLFMFQTLCLKGSVPELFIKHLILQLNFDKNIFYFFVCPKKVTKKATTEANLKFYFHTSSRHEGHKNFGFVRLRRRHLPTLTDGILE